MASRQVSLSKNIFLLRTYMGKWRVAVTRRQNLEQRVMHVDTVRRLRYAFRKWMESIEEKRRREIREGIRRRYSLIKHAVDDRILRQAFKVGYMICDASQRNQTQLFSKCAYPYACQAWSGCRTTWQFIELL